MTKKKTDDTLDLTPAKREELRNAFMKKGISEILKSVETTLLKRATDSKATPTDRERALTELWGFRSICGKVLIGDTTKRVEDATPKPKPKVKK